MSPWPALALFVSAAAFSSHLSDALYREPVGQLAQYEFTQGETLGIASGAWVASAGTFNSTSTSTAIATIDSYRPPFVYQEDLTAVIADKFWFRARMLNERSGSSTRVGIVYHYQDPANFYEVTFSPSGAVFVREVVDGASSTVATGTYGGGGQGKWFDVSMEWSAEETIVLVNGLPVVRGIQQSPSSYGKVGLITRQTTARFDRLLVTRAYGDPEFRESFSDDAPAWNAVSGNWNVVNGVYQNTAVEPASVNLLPITVGSELPRQSDQFTLRARMMNPYGASGNRMGIAFAYQDRGDGTATYEEVVFGPDGIARANSVETVLGPGGKTRVTPIETAPYPGRRGEWFDVEFNVEAEVNHVRVLVNGAPVFEHLGSNPTGQIGLITHWTPGRFDDVSLRHDYPLSLSETFDSDEGWWPLSGTWDIAGTVLNNRSVGQNDAMYVQAQRSTDYTMSVRMLNPYGASGNRIGVTFGVDPTVGDYYEVVFAPTGQAYLNKFIQGSLTQVATSTHNALGRNVWFTVELTRHGPYATVKVNNQTVFQNVAAAQLDNTLNSGWVGLISHWSPARFDDLRVEELW